MKTAAKRLAIAGVAAAGLLGAGVVASSIQSETAAVPASESPSAAVLAAAQSAIGSPENSEGSQETTATTKRAPTPQLAPLNRDETPMNERVAVLGVLNKRNGVSREVTLRPGEARRLGNLIVRLRACETTDPTELEQLTGAFVQADLQARDGKWRRIFSGWLYKESPSLNVVEDALYDVWPKSCAMKHPDIGPNTVAASAGAAGGGGAKRSSAKKSADAAPATPAAAPPPSASAPSNNPV